MANSSVLTEGIRKKIHKKLFEFAQTLDQFQMLREKLALLLDDALSEQKVTIKTARDVQIIADSYVKLADAESRLASTITQLLKALNERDALMVALLSSNQAQVQLSNPEEMRLLVPIVDPAGELPGIAEAVENEGESEE